MTSSSAPSKSTYQATADGAFSNVEFGMPTGESRVKAALAAAQSLAREGFGIVEVYPPNKTGGCTCPKGSRCQAPGKHPVGKEWQRRATRSPHTIEKIVVSRAGQYGVVPWPGERGLILDIDHPNELPVILPPSMQVASSLGRSHFYYRLPADFDAATLPATSPWGEVRVEGAARHVVGPYGRHASGSVYRPNNDPITEMPRDVLAKLVSHSPLRMTDRSSGGYDFPEPGYAASRYEAIRNYVASRFMRGLSREEIWAGVHEVLAPRFLHALTEAQLRERFERTWAGTAERLGEPTVIPADASRFEPTPLARLMTEGLEPPRYLLDGFLYRGYVTSLHGPSGEGKSLLLVAVAADAIRRGMRVCYLDEDNGAAIIADRLLHLGCDAGLIETNFAYFDFRSFGFGDAGRLLEALRAFGPELVVFDSGADFYAAAGVDENDNVAITRWAHSFAQPVARQLGAAVVVIEAIAANGSGRKARGASAKRYKVDVEWSFSAKPPPARDRIGTVVLTCTKDRLGYLPAERRFRLGGDGEGRLVFEPATTEASGKDDTDPRTDVAARIVAVHVDRDARSAQTGLRRNEVKRLVGGNAERVVEGVTRLVDGGVLYEADGPYRSRLTWLPGRSDGSGTTAE